MKKYEKKLGEVSKRENIIADRYLIGNKENAVDALSSLKKIFPLESAELKDAKTYNIIYGKLYNDIKNVITTNLGHLK